MFALAWLAAECVTLVGVGVWWPLLAFFAAFVLALILLGCMSLEAGTTERVGTAFVVLIVLGLLGFAAASFAAGATATGVVKAILALAYGALAIPGTRTAGSAAA